MIAPVNTNTALWRKGWLANCKHLHSPNFGARPAHANIDLIVVHSISLPPGEYGNLYVEQLFTNQLDWDAHPYFQTIRDLKVSAHFFITRQGETTQFVSCDDRAWHAGSSRWQNRENCNDFSIGIELEGLEGLTFTAHQYQALSQLCRSLGHQYPIAHIAGHEHIAPNRKKDPGPAFDWSHLEHNLQDLAWLFPRKP